MADFDPYHKWLGIPPHEQPANLYRLLGIVAFEADPDVIATAADQRMAHLRGFQSGPNAALSQRLLNEMSRARVTLLDPSEKDAYDDALRVELDATGRMATFGSGPPPLAPLSPPHKPATPLRPVPVLRTRPGQAAAGQAVDAALTNAGAPSSVHESNGGNGGLDFGFAALGSEGGRTGASTSTTRVRPRSPRSSAYHLTGIVVGGVIGLAIGYSLLCNIRPDLDFLGLFPDHTPTADAGRDRAATSAGSGSNSARDKGSSQPANTSGYDSTQRSPVGSRDTVRQPIRDNDSSPVRPTTKKALTPASALAALPAAVDLPPVSDVAARTLCEFGSDDVSLSAITVTAAGANLPSGITIQADGQADVRQKWKLAIGSGATAPAVAAMALEGRKLQFQWLPDARNSPAAGQLPWCFMRLVVGGVSRTVALRTPAADVPLSLEMSARETTHHVWRGKIPSPDAVWLEVAGLEHWPSGASVHGGRNRAPFQAKDPHPLAIGLGKVNDADFPEIRLTLVATDQGFDLVVQRVLKTPLGEFDLTKPQVEAVRSSTEKQLVPLRKEVFDLEERGKRVEADIAALVAQRPSTPNGVRTRDRDLAQKRRTLGQMRVQQQTLRRKIEPLERVQRGIPPVDQVVSQLAGMKLEFRLFCPVGDGEVELVRTPGFPVAPPKLPSTDEDSGPLFVKPERVAD